jgi:hypothetical protein
VNRCRVTATHDVPILAAQAHCHTCASGRSRSVIKSEITPAHKPADLVGCAAKIGDAGGRAEWGDRRAGRWPPRPMDLGVDVGVFRYGAAPTGSYELCAAGQSGAAGQAGQHVVDHRRIGRAGGWQVSGLSPSPVCSVRVAGPWPVHPARMAYSSTPPVNVARQPPRIP